MFKKMSTVALIAQCFLHSDALLALDLDVSNVSWDGVGNNKYSAFTTEEDYQNVSFAVERTIGDGDDDDDDDDDNNGDGTGEKKFIVGFSKGNASSYTRYLINGSYKLYYQIHNVGREASRILKECDDASSDKEVIRGKLKRKKKTTQKNYNIKVDPLQVCAPGVYSDVFTVGLYEGDKINNCTFVESKDVVFTVDVPADIQMSVVDSGGSFDEDSLSKTLDFGEIEDGEEQHCDIRIRSNAGYVLTIESENNGVMKHNDGYEATIPYGLSIDGSSKDVSSEAEVASSWGTTSQEGNVHSLSVQINGIDGFLSGSYSDTLSLTCTTNE
jgi:hypothetical protein